MAENTSVADLVSKLPDPDERGLLSKIDKNVVDTVTRDLLQGRGESVHLGPELAVVDRPALEQDS